MPIYKRSNRKRQGGATLIEALVSMLIMSFGMLGLAGMQLSALGFQKSSWSTHRVSEITGDFAERVRANPKAVDADYQYVATYAVGKAASPTKLGCRTSGTCTTTQIAGDDLADLLTKAQTSLPQGSIQIAGTLANGLVINTMYLDKDFVDSAGALQTSTACSAASTGIAWRNCCPPEASAPAGVRCRRSTIIP